MQYNLVTLIQYSAIYSSTIQYNLIQYNLIQYNLIQCNVAIIWQYSPPPCCGEFRRFAEGRGGLWKVVEGCGRL